MNIIQTIAVAFSMFSKVPMPQFTWREENMKYSLVAFPLIGALIGGVLYGVQTLASLLEFPQIFTGLLLCSLPFWITGGIHLDGYLDTMDAVSSYKSREEKLQILKDPHIGSFGVMHAILILFWNAGAWLCMPQVEWYLLLLVFVFSRSLSGLAVCSFPMAKDTGLVHMFATEAVKGNARGALFVLSMALTVTLLMISDEGAILAGIGWCMYGVYYLFSRRVFGGITGDLAGWFVTLTETLFVCALAVAPLLGL
jgi:adenosylcobinamide-GDP ribazoletransferase